MKFEVTILGSGSAVPTTKRNPAGQIVNIHETYLLIDCGEGTQLRLKESAVKMQRIRYVFISHLHGDHFFGLPGLLSTLHLLGREKPLDIFGPPGLKNAVMGMVELGRDYLRYELNFHETKDDQSNLLVDRKSFQVWSFPLLHKIPTTGFWIKEKPKKRHYDPNAGLRYDVPIHWIDRIKSGMDFVNEAGEVVPNHLLTSPAEVSKSYAYCSDTAFFPELEQYLQEPDVLYHESTFLESEKARANETKHSTAKQAAEMALRLKSKCLVLGHFSARYRKEEKFKSEAEQIFNNVVIAYDGLVINP
ncbi:MAG: ribonuclease Z [Luteibaculum sp.]